LSIAVAAFSLVGMAVFVAEYLARHGFDPPVLPYGGWQVDLVLAGYALMGLGLLAAASFGIRRSTTTAAIPRSFQILSGFIAVLLGTSAAVGFHHQPERAYNWASAKTASFHRFAENFGRQLQREFGDANHPPTLRNPGEPATKQQSAPLLVPGDLGTGWRYAGAPPDTVGQPTAPGLEYAVRTFLTAEHWNGTLWTHDQDLIESVSSYSTAAETRKAILSDVHTTEACSFPGSCTADQTFARSRIGGLDVWQESESDPHALNALILDGRSTVLVFGTAPSGVNAMPQLTGAQILDATIRRLTSADRSK
jgi:hypothetical protein